MVLLYSLASHGSSPGEVFNYFWRRDKSPLEKNENFFLYREASYLRTLNLGFGIIEVSYHIHVTHVSFYRFYLKEKVYFKKIDAYVVWVAHCTEQTMFLLLVI